MKLEEWREVFPESDLAVAWSARRLHWTVSSDNCSGQGEDLEKTIGAVALAERRVLEGLLASAKREQVYAEKKIAEITAKLGEKKKPKTKLKRPKKGKKGGK